VSSRFRAKGAINEPHSKFARVSGMQMMQFNIPRRCVRHFTINTDTCWIDRRRLAREIRREVQSIRRAIDALGAKIPQVRVHV
jgi:hypothetical protein